MENSNVNNNFSDAYHQREQKEASSRWRGCTQLAPHQQYWAIALLGQPKWQHCSLSHIRDCLFLRARVSKRKRLVSGEPLASASTCVLWKPFFRPSRLPAESLDAGACCCSSGKDRRSSGITTLSFCGQFGRYLSIVSEGAASLLLKDGTVSVMFKRKWVGEKIFMSKSIWETEDTWIATKLFLPGYN